MELRGSAGRGSSSGKKEEGGGKAVGIFGGKEEDGSRGKRIFVIKDKQEEGREGDIWRGKKRKGLGGEGELANDHGL